MAPGACPTRAGPGNHTIVAAAAVPRQAWSLAAPDSATAAMIERQQQCA